MAGPQKDSLQNLANALIPKSDPGCVLVSAAWLEDQLRFAIDVLLIKLSSYGNHFPGMDAQKSLRDDLLNGAIGSAKARVTLCRAIGMIDEPTAAALNALFSLRNH